MFFKEFYLLANIILILRKDNHNETKITKIQYEVHLADHCNLNCQMCDHFSPLANENFLSPDHYASDVERLSELFDHDANYIRLLGGEPLLHPQVVRFLKFQGSIFQTVIWNYTQMDY